MAGRIINNITGLYNRSIKPEDLDMRKYQIQNENDKINKIFKRIYNKEKRSKMIKAEKANIKRNIRNKIVSNTSLYYKSNSIVKHLNSEIMRKRYFNSYIKKGKPNITNHWLENSTHTVRVFYHNIYGTMSNISTRVSNKVYKYLFPNCKKKDLNIFGNSIDRFNDSIDKDVLITSFTFNE